MPPVVDLGRPAVQYQVFVPVFVPLTRASPLADGLPGRPPLSLDGDECRGLGAGGLPPLFFRAKDRILRRRDTTPPYFLPFSAVPAIGRARSGEEGIVPRRPRAILCRALPPLAVAANIEVLPRRPRQCGCPRPAHLSRRRPARKGRRHNCTRISKLKESCSHVTPGRPPRCFRLRRCARQRRARRQRARRPGITWGS